MSQKIALIGKNAAAQHLAEVLSQRPMVEAEDIPEGGEVDPVQLDHDMRETEAKLIANLEADAPGGEHLTLPNKQAIRNYMLQRNVQIKRQLEQTLSPDDKTMLEFAETMERRIGELLVADDPQEKSIILSLGDFLIITRRNGFYELEAYDIVNNPNNKQPTTKLRRTWNINRIVMNGQSNNPFTLLRLIDNVHQRVDIFDVSPLSTLNRNRTEGILQSITIGVYNVVLALRAKKWGVVTLCPDATETKVYKPTLIMHPIAPTGLNGLLSMCVKNSLSTRPRKDYCEYMLNQSAT